MCQQSGRSLEGDNLFCSVAFSPDANLIASGSAGPSFSSSAYAVQLWNVQMRKAVSAPFKGHTDHVWSVSFSPDSARVVSGSWDKTICIWDIERGIIAGPLKGHTGRVRVATFSPNGAQILSCSDDGTIRFWDARSRRTIGELYKGHTNTVFSATFSPGGTYVASGGGDKTVRLWDIRTGHQVDQPFEEHTNVVNSVAFSPCGRFIASGSNDCKVIIRRVLAEAPDPDDVAGPDDVAEPQTVTSQMSIQQVFECLCRAGCIDLSSQMDIAQETAMIASGGGFGDIWKGKLHNGGTVAIKAWRTSALGQCEYKTIKRAARELYLWSRMHHPHIHRLQGVILFRDQYLGMVSEWMDNGNLHEYLRKHPDADRYQLCVQVASGLDYMHSHGMVHGDLKALNVLVSPEGTARLSDFDFSIMSEATDLVFTASSNTRPGSIRWVAPEMLSDETPSRTTQSDVYALGMTILEVFTGQVPYPERRLDVAVMMAVVQGILPTRPVEHLKDDEQGNAVWNLVLKCWSRELSERPSAGQVLEVLESHTDKR